MSLNHKDTLRLLFPLDIGGDHEADTETEGAQLDAVQTHAAKILKNLFADSTHELIPDWERVLGLSPAEDAAVTARRADIVAKLRELGGLSIPYFTTLAESMGYEIEIVEPQPFMAGIDSAGYPVQIAEIIWCWRVDVVNAQDPSFRFRSGDSAAGDPLLGFLARTVETMFEELKPAHTFCYFTYP